jgi:UDP-N-acetylglucosamine 4,6-dehydratase/5-epimerase
MGQYIIGKRILTTGGTGSLGHALISRLPPIRELSASLYSREQKQIAVASRVSDNRAVWFIGDVRDRDRLPDVLHGADTVVDAAALKAVPKGERDPSEFIKSGSR